MYKYAYLIVQKFRIDFFSNVQNVMGVDATVWTKLSSAK